MKSLYLTTSILLSILLLFSCNEKPEPMPKPFGYARIVIPKQTQYTTLESKTCPFTFEYPAFGEITRDREDSCWVDIYFKQYDIKWHISHHNIRNSGKDRAKHYEDFRKLVFKHTKKASNIAEIPVKVPAGQGTIFEMFGNVGTPLEFWIGDSADVMEGNAYFNTAIRNDSLAPIIDYMRKEMKHSIETLKWKR